MKDNELSKLLLEVVPPLIRLIRAEIKNAASGTLTFPQFRVLANIHRGLNTVGEIAEHHGVSQPAMTKMVNHLVEMGYIEKTKSFADARCSILVLTSKGKKTRQKIWDKAQTQLSGHLGSISKKDSKTIIDSLLRLKETMGSSSIR